MYINKDIKNKRRFGLEEKYHHIVIIDVEGTMNARMINIIGLFGLQD